jgi:shikimate dehydrogenase
MPSCGKTTVGSALAERLARPLVDTDALVERRTHRTPRQIIEQDGEDAFRQIEATAVADACDSRGAVISLGGGAVLLERNRDLIRRTSMVVYLTRDLDALTDVDRPTLRTSGAAALFARRDPIYRATADVTVDNNGTLDAAVQAIISAYENFSD